MRKFFLVSISWLFVSQAWAAGIPAQITYQGTLKQKGVPASGQTNMLFRITNIDGTIVYWSSGNQVVTVNQGLFSTPLSPTGVDWQNVTPYIEVSVEGQLLTPREPVNASVYATIAGSIVDGAVTTAKLADLSVTTQKLADNSITTPQLADNSVVSSKLGDNSVVAQKLADNSVTTSKLVDNAVTWRKIDPTSIPSTGPGFVPSGAILIFDRTCPPGWSSYSALNNGNFPRGSPNFSGVTGGASTHSHLLPIFQEGNGPGFGLARPQDSPWGGQTINGSVNTLTFNSGATLNNLTAMQSSPASNLPPYLEVVFCQKN